MTDLIINIVIVITILSGITWTITIIISFFSGPSKLSKSHKSNVINHENFQKLEELFLDAVNLYSCPVTKDTIEVAPASKLCATAIAKSVSEEQKQQLISSLTWVSDMGAKAGLAKNVIDKHKEIIEYIDQKKWSLIDAIKDKEELNELNKDFLDAINNYKGDYFKIFFPKHFN